MLLTMTIQAGTAVRFSDLGNFFRLLEAVGDVSVTFFRDGGEVAASPDISAGYAEEFSERFDAFEIASATTQIIKFVSRLGSRVAFDAPPTGVVTLTGQQGAFTQAQKTVTNASGVLLAANAARRYVLIQNNDASGDIYITLDGTAATTAKGIKIAAGSSYECQGFCPSGAVYAIGSIASNANIVAVEA